MELYHGCLFQICQGGVVPEEFYLSQGGETGDQMDTTIIAKGDKFTMEILVEKAGSILRYIVIQSIWGYMHITFWANNGIQSEILDYTFS